MKKYPFVSVIIPTLNEEKYIEPTLLSIRNQDYKGKYEIIVVDSGSNDKTVEIAKRYADKIIVIEKKGVSAGRNAGAMVAGGEILLFVDADTILLPNVISEAVERLKKKDVVAVSIPFIGDDVTKNIFYILGCSTNYLFSKINLCITSAVCLACKKDAFWKVGGFNENLYVTEDVDLGLRLKKVGKIEIVKSTLAVTSARRLKKWSIFKQTAAWPLGYLYIKLLNKQPKYPPYSVV
jgi:glycosyltransferase involved in cell wall biosynthesis